MKTVVAQLILFAFLIVPPLAFSQKLPNVQEKGLRAPAGLNIDGKPSEWNNQFMAYNHATDIFYTLCNDDDNLYLVVHVSDQDALTKITNRGVVLSINPRDKKSDDASVSITYPVFDLRYGNKPYIAFTNSGGLMASQRRAIAANPDSMVAVANKKLNDNEKFIRTSGMQGIDTLLSIYNQDGIKARESFDSAMAYTYELALPLRLLQLPRGDKGKFYYHLSLPGLNVDEDYGLKVIRNDAGQPVSVSSAPGAAMSMPKKDHIAAVVSTTDFWGEYTLQK